MALLVLSILALDIVANIVLVQEIREALSYIKSKCEDTREGVMTQFNNNRSCKPSRSNKVGSQSESRGGLYQCKYSGYANRC